MDNLRVSICGRHYDIPKEYLSQTTLDSLSSIMDAQNAINPRDLLRVFLEASEIQAHYKKTLVEANMKLQYIKDLT